MRWVHMRLMGRNVRIIEFDYQGKFSEFHLLNDSVTEKVEDIRFLVMWVFDGLFVKRGELKITWFLHRRDCRISH